MTRFEKQVRQALDLRAHQFGVPTLTSSEGLCLFDGRTEGIKDLRILKLGPLIEFHCATSQQEAELLSLDLKALFVESGMGEELYLKKRPKDRSHQEASGPKPLLASGCQDRWMTEGEIKLVIRPMEPHCSGVFIDMTPMRMNMARTLCPKTVLNLFSYTSAFSVHFAQQGARTTNVDISKKYLQWSKENFKLNGLEISHHDFYCRDVISFLSKSVWNKHQYDCIILDPPTFSRPQKGKIFKVSETLPAMVQACWQLLNPGGHLLVAHNDSRHGEKLLDDVLGEFETGSFRIISASESEQRGFSLPVHWDRLLEKLG